MSDDDAPKAVVREIDGQVVLEDPVALEMVRVVAKHNCRGTRALNAERIEHFKARVAALGRSPADTVIVILNVDMPYGRSLADALMPGHDWQAYRDRGQIPFARGLAGRGGIQCALDAFDPDAATKLHATTALAVVVIDHGVAEVFLA